MQQLVYLKLRLSSNQPGRESMVRVDFISEVHPRRSASTPYQLIGSRVFLTTGRELEVVDTPDDIQERIFLVVNAADGGWSSEGDG